MLINWNLHKESNVRLELTLFLSKQEAEEAVVAQLASARLSEREVSGSIFSDFNVCTDRGRGVKGTPLASINTSLVAEGTTDVK